MVTGGLNTSILARAMERGLIGVEARNIRDYTMNKHNKVDDYTYGGGAGMLMQAQPVYDACQAVQASLSSPARVVYLTPQGALFTQQKARELAQEEHLILLCGHYEGIDERALEEVGAEYLSVGDYVLTGGELAAMIVVDAVSRLVPGVLNNHESAQTDSFGNGLLEYPQYSRPEEWRGRRVPEILLSGDHAKVDAWRLEQSLLRTKERRPELYEAYMAAHPPVEKKKRRRKKAAASEQPPEASAAATVSEQLPEVPAVAAATGQPAEAHAAAAVSEQSAGAPAAAAVSEQSPEAPETEQERKI